MNSFEKHIISFGISLYAVLILLLLWFMELISQYIYIKHNKRLKRIKSTINFKHVRMKSPHRIGRMKLIGVRIGLLGSIWLLIKAIDPVGARNVTALWLREVASFHVDLLFLEVWITVGYYVLLVTVRMEPIMQSSGKHYILMAWFRHLFSIFSPIGHILAFTPLLNFITHWQFLIHGLFLLWFNISVITFVTLCSLGVIRFTNYIEQINRKRSSIISNPRQSTRGQLELESFESTDSSATFDLSFEENTNVHIVRGNSNRNIQEITRLRKWFRFLFPLEDVVSKEEKKKHKSMTHQSSKYKQMIAKIWRFMVCVWVVTVPIVLLVGLTVIKSVTNDGKRNETSTNDYSAQSYALFWLQITCGYLLFSYVHEPVFDKHN